MHFVKACIFRESGVTDYYAVNEIEAISIARNVVETLPCHSSTLPSIPYHKPAYSQLELQGLAGSTSPIESFAHQVFVLKTNFCGLSISVLFCLSFSYWHDCWTIVNFTNLEPYTVVA